MSYRGKVRNGRVEFESGPIPPDGTLVQIETLSTSSDPNGDASNFVDEMLKLAGAAQGLPPDLARNHDHYLHGHPKK